MQRTGVLVAATLAVIVIGLPLTILLIFDSASSQAACGASASPGAADSTAGVGAGMQPVSSADWAAQINQLYPINGGRTLPADVIAALAESAGRTLGVDVPGETMAQVTIGESSQEPGSHGFDPNGITQGYGLWSITTVYNDDLVSALGGYGQMLNPIKNALVMAEIYRRQGIGGWYGTRYVTNWNEHYTGRLALVNLKSVLGLPSSQSQFASTGGAMGACPATSGLLTGPVTPGTQSHILPNGLATIPQTAPAAVQRAISAGNRIIHTFYSQERRAGMLSEVQDSYDCSGSSAYVLYQAGLSDSTVDVGDQIAGDSSSMAGYGQSGGGQWMTVFASSAHEFIKVDNVVLDTAHYAPVAPSSVPDPYPPDDPTNGGPTSGPRWQPASMIPAQLADGNAWTQRHPAGL